MHIVVIMCNTSGMVDEAMRIRVIRAITGMSKEQFRGKLGISGNSLRWWESGAHVPRPAGRKALADLCKEFNISIRPDGFPVPGE